VQGASAVSLVIQQLTAGTMIVTLVLALSAASLFTTIITLGLVRPAKSGGLYETYQKQTKAGMGSDADVAGYANVTGHRLC
jgi:hypothetical protein